MIRFETTVEDGVIRVPPDLRLMTGETVVVLVPEAPAKVIGLKIRELIEQSPGVRTDAQIDAELRILREEWDD